MRYLGSEPYTTDYKIKAKNKNAHLQALLPL
jgi:hypothetical protein